MTPRPTSFHLEHSSSNEAASRSRHGSLRWQDAPSRPSSASYHPDSNEWSRASKRTSVQSFQRSSMLPLPRSMTVNNTPSRPPTLDCSFSSPTIPTTTSESQSRIPVLVQRKPTNTNKNKNFYVVGRKTASTTTNDPSLSPRLSQHQPDSPSSPSPGTIAAKAFRRSVASSHCVMQLETANASNLSFHSTASGGVGVSVSVRPARTKSQVSTQTSLIPHVQAKSRGAVGSVAGGPRADGRNVEDGGEDSGEMETELPYHYQHNPISLGFDNVSTIQPQQHQQRQPQHVTPWLNHEQTTPSISDFGEASSFFREIMDSREEEEEEKGSDPPQPQHPRLLNPALASKPTVDQTPTSLTIGFGDSVDSADHRSQHDVRRTSRLPSASHTTPPTRDSDRHPSASTILQAMASETQRLLDERYGVLSPGLSAPAPAPSAVTALPPLPPPPPIVVVGRDSTVLLLGEEGKGGGGGRGDGAEAGAGDGGGGERGEREGERELTRTGTQKSVLTSYAKRVPPPSMPSPLRVPSPPHPPLHQPSHQSRPNHNPSHESHPQPRLSSHSSLVAQKPVPAAGTPTPLPQSSNFVRISRRTPRPPSLLVGAPQAKTPASARNNGNSKAQHKHIPKHSSSLFGRLFFGSGGVKPKAKVKAQTKSQSKVKEARMEAVAGRMRVQGRAASWITGTFVIDPMLRVPKGILGGSGLDVVTAKASVISKEKEGGRAGERNLLLEVQNGGIDVTVRLVPALTVVAPCSARAGYKGLGGREGATKIELRLLSELTMGEDSKKGGGRGVNVSANGKGKDGVDGEEGGEDEEKDEVFPIIARIDAPHPRAPMHLVASTVVALPPPHSSGDNRQSTYTVTPSKSRSPDVKDYVLVDSPLTTASSPIPTPRGATNSAVSTTKYASAGGTPKSPSPTTRNMERATERERDKDNQRLSRSSTGKTRRLSKASSSTARPYHLPSSLVTNTEQGSSASAEDAGVDGEELVPFPTESPGGSHNPRLRHGNPKSIASPLRSSGEEEINRSYRYRRLSNRYLQQRINSSPSPIYLTLPTTFRGPLSVIVLSLSGAGGLADHVEMSDRVRSMAVLLEETCGEGEGRGVWFVGGLGDAEGGVEGEGGVGSEYSGRESSDEDYENNVEEEGKRVRDGEKERVMSGVWLAGGRVMMGSGEIQTKHNGMERQAKVRRSATSPSTPTRPMLDSISNNNRTPNSHSKSSTKRRMVSNGRDAPTPTPPSRGLSGLVQGWGVSTSDSDSTYPIDIGIGNDIGTSTGKGFRKRRDRGERRRERMERGESEEWSGDRVEIVVGRGKVFLRFWDECEVGGMGM